MNLCASHTTKSLLLLAAFALSGLGVIRQAHAQTYPSKPIRMVVPYAPGGNADITARLIAKKMSDSMGVPILVDNKGGANGMIGTDIVAKAPADGYTLLMDASGPLVINPGLYAKVPYDTLKDFIPISQILTYQYVLVVPTGSPITSLPALVAKAKAEPGKLSYGSTGIGGGGHLAGELLALMTGTQLTHVPYKGSAPALADLLGGHLAFTYDTVITSVPQIEAKQLLPFAVSGPTRAKSLPQVPTMQELGYKGFDITQFVGLLAPAKTDPAIITRLHQEAVKAVKSAEVVQRLGVEGGNELVGSSPAEFSAQIQRELLLYEKLVKDANIKPQ
jgi:tripartite-type tricarboxylate transporter receptor subunit TctC